MHVYTLWIFNNFKAIKILFKKYIFNNTFVLIENEYSKNVIKQNNNNNNDNQQTKINVQA